MKRDTWRRCGQTLRYVLFAFNAIPWAVAIASIIGGFVLGFVTRLIQWPLRKEDFRITTPAIAFIFYGSFMILVTTIGCFSASSANRWVLVCFLLFGILLFLWDSFLGISVFVNLDSLEIFMSEIQHSANDYGNLSAPRMGFFRTTAQEVWDHMQTRGVCCGYLSYKDWLNTTIGRNDSIPNTCCRHNYRHRKCGEGLWSSHPVGGYRHSIEDVVVTKGCVSLWPPSFIDSLDFSGFFGVAIGVCFLFCFLLALILLLLVCLKKYHPDWGILAKQKKRLSRLSLVPAAGGAGAGDETRRGKNKVGPADKPALDRYLYKSAQVHDEEADNYAPELKRTRMEGEFYRGRRRSTIQGDMAKDAELFARRNPDPRPNDIATSQVIMEGKSKKARFA